MYHGTSVYNTAVTRKNGPFQKARIVDTSIYKKLIAHVVHLTMKVLSESVSVPESRYPLLNSRSRS